MRMRVNWIGSFVAGVLVLVACGGGGADDQPDDDAGAAAFCTGAVPATCGDSACSTDQGETPDNCRADCVPDSCGDGNCEAADGETTENCSEDCNTVCITDQFKPVYCKTDGGCWEEGTDCCAEIFTCGDVKVRCDHQGQTIHCCDGERAARCGVGGGGYYCPDPSTPSCVASPADCAVPVCEVLETCGPTA